MSRKVFPPTGDLSYPIHLVHASVLMVIGRWWVANAFPLAAPGYVTIAAFVVASTLAAVAVHWVFEKPAARVTRAIGYPGWRPVVEKA